GLGETQNERIVVQESETDFSVFFPANTELPDIIEINKKTLEVIGLGMDSGKWIYIFSQGEGGFSVELEVDIDPESLCSRWDYEAMEKHLRVLAIFDLNI
ncbi:MAG: hypothetical protein IT269_02400, partial [Saprospiraceae bacterium]|nr:hypothetical protein [Saprospiraceae bacterium]